MNRTMTLGQDIHWRKVVIAQAQLPSGGRLLDIATGTGDIAWEGCAAHLTYKPSAAISRLR